MPGLSFIMFKEIKHNKKTVSIIIRNSFSSNHTNFFTNKSSEFQLGIIVKNKDDIVPKHFHNKRLSKIKSTSEVLIIRSGEVIISIYNPKCTKLISKTILKKGDIIFLNNCGHKLKFLKKTKMIEIKQGPYLGLKDKQVKQN